MGESESEDDPGTSPKRVHSNPIWGFFTHSSDKKSARCKTCGNHLKTPTSTTSPLINHLKRHVDVYETYAKVLEGTGIGKPKPKRMKTGATQQTITNCWAPVPKEKKERLDKAVAVMLAVDMKPYSCVEDRGFKKLMEIAVPGYTLPSRTTFSRSYMPSLYKETRLRLQETISADIVNCASLALTTDGWKSRHGDNYNSLTLHYVDKNMHYKHYTLANHQITEQHTAVNLRKSLEDELRAWSIPGNAIPIFIVSDNARNITAAISNNSSGWVHRKCFAHTLQLAITDAKKNSEVQPLLKKVRGIVGRYNSSDPARRSLETIQKEMNLPVLHVVQDVETRWNSELAMLKRLLEVKIPISRAIASDEWSDVLSGSEWKSINALVDILGPLESATTMSSGVTYPTSSMIIPLVAGILSSLKAYLDHNQKLAASSSVPYRYADELKKAIMARFPVMDDLVSKKATFLDPRYKSLVLTKNDTVLLTRLLTTEAEPEAESNAAESETSCMVDVTTQNELHEPEPSTSQSQPSFWDFMETLKAQNNHDDIATNKSLVVQAEIRRYLQVPLAPLTTNVFEWWRTQQFLYPNLATLARKYLAIPATSVPSERMFSVAGNIVSSRRESLLPENVEILTFLHDNLSV